MRSRIFKFIRKYFCSKERTTKLKSFKLFSIGKFFSEKFPFPFHSDETFPCVNAALSAGCIRKLKEDLQKFTYCYNFSMPSWWMRKIFSAVRAYYVSFLQVQKPFWCWKFNITAKGKICTIMVKLPISHTSSIKMVQLATEQRVFIVQTYIHTQVQLGTKRLC